MKYQKHSQSLSSCEKDLIL